MTHDRIPSRRPRRPRPPPPSISGRGTAASPFFEKTLEAGCSAYDIYNHMYLPGYYADPIEEYWALLNGVTLWDVSVERIVEITGPDASEFTNRLTCRDLTKCAVGQGKYVLITAEDGGIVNDPVLLRVEADRWWLALADSDAGLWARGVGRLLRARRPGPRAGGLPGPGPGSQVEGRHARRSSAPAVRDIKYYWTLTTEVDGIPVVISRTGWTGEVGYEVYLRDPSRGGELWDRLMDAGKPHDIRPIAPCEARRIEAGIFNYGSDMTIRNNPFEIMGLERLVEVQEADYIGKTALEDIRARGGASAVSERLVGVEVDGDALGFEIADKRPAFHQGERVGTRDRPHLVAEAREEHRLRVGPDGVVGAGHAARDRVGGGRALARPDRRDPVHRPEEDRPAGLIARTPGSAPGTLGDRRRLRPARRPPGRSRSGTPRTATTGTGRSRPSRRSGSRSR